MAEKRAQAKQINYWKWAFAILLALVIATVLFIGHKLTTPSVDQTRISQQTKQVDKNVDLDVSMNKQQLSAMINYYLRKSQKKSKIKYRFILDKSAILMGTTKVLGSNVSFTLYAKPSLDAKGNIVLDAKSVSVGSLNVPANFVLRYVKNNYDLGKFATIDYKKSRIILNLAQVSAKQGIKVNGQKFDLKQNKFLFNVALPLK